MKRKISIFGSTGSVGSKMVDFVANNLELFDVVCLTCYSNYNLIIEQSKLLQPEYILVSSKKAYAIVKDALPEFKVLPGEELNNVATIDTDISCMAMSGRSALLPTIYSLGHAKILAIANKEAIVSGGNFLMSLACQKGTKVIPVDSEHNAIFQCLVGEESATINEIILTCSGGPLLDLPDSELEHVTVENALKHPNWRMGKKITIDSATIMNKGLEILEASFLFNIDVGFVTAVIHRQSIVHGLVKFRDSSMKALLSYPDMSIPVNYALNYPNRCTVSNYDFDLTSLSFEKFRPWQKRSLELAYRAYREKKCIVLDVINEKSVCDFLAKKIKFTDIQENIEKALNSSEPVNINSIQDIIFAQNYADELY